MALRILTGERAEALDGQAAWPAAAELLAGQIGGSLAGEWDDLRRAALRQMALTEIAAATDGLPDALVPAWGAGGRRAAPAHGRAAASVAERTRCIARTTEPSPTWSTTTSACRATLPWADGLAALHRDARARRASRFARRSSGSPTTTRRALPPSRSSGSSTSPWVQPQGPAGDGVGIRSLRVGAR